MPVVFIAPVPPTAGSTTAASCHSAVRATRRMDVSAITWASVAHRLLRLSLFQGTSRPMPDMCIGRIRVHAQSRLAEGPRCTGCRTADTTNLPRSAVHNLWRALAQKSQASWDSFHFEHFVDTAHS